MRISSSKLGGRPSRIKPRPRTSSQSETSATRNTSASSPTSRAPLRWSAVSLATTVPSPVQGEPRRRPPGDSPGRLLSGIAGILEIAVVDLGQARRGELDAGQLDDRGELARDLGAQVALAVDPITVDAKRLHPDDARHRGEPLRHPRSARLDIDDMAPAKHPTGQLGD